MVRVMVAGAAGRMGRRIIHMVDADSSASLSGAIEREGHPSLEQDAGLLCGLGEKGVRISSSIEDIIDQGDVIIDFTAPESTLSNIKAVSAAGKAMVIGTTGMTGALLKEVENLARGIRCVIAPNMSVGMNVLFKVAGDVARILGNDYDMEIVEAHHRLKKDAPSGTAMHLGRIIAAEVGRDLDEVGVYARKGITGQRSDEEICIQSLRAGDITGDHTVLFGGAGERLELIHRAHSRDNFAKGALRAACWVVDQEPGLYDMQDVLGLR